MGQCCQINIPFTNVDASLDSASLQSVSIDREAMGQNILHPQDAAVQVIRTKFSGGAKINDGGSFVVGVDQNVNPTMTDLVQTVLFDDRFDGQGNDALLIGMNQYRGDGLMGVLGFAVPAFRF